MTALPLPTPDALQPILEELRAREPLFHRPAFASSLADFDRLMAPEYWEVGASGRRYSRDFILAHLQSNAPVDADTLGWTTRDFHCLQLGLATYLLTYTLAQGERLTRRATVWCLASGAWQILYHQGTIVAGLPDNTAPGTDGYIPRPS